MKLVFSAIAILLLAASTAPAFDHSHKRFDDLLQRRVKRGRVDYQALRKNDAAALDAYLKELASVTQKEIAGWTREQKLAYWINAYNAYTLKAILDHYPIKPGSWLARARFPHNSIRQIPGVWDKLSWRAGGEKLTLNQIENQKLRTELKEPRIHFAIVCASVGCPWLHDRAYTAENIEGQLDAAVKRFVRNPHKVRVGYQEKTLYLSPIFKWFGADFEDFRGLSAYGEQEGVVTFVAQYLRPHRGKFVKQNTLKVVWLDYDWSLNEQ